jgi:hypothetical protein
MMMMDDDDDDDDDDDNDELQETKLRIHKRQQAKL